MEKVFLMTLLMTMRMILIVETVYQVASASDIDAFYNFAEKNFQPQNSSGPEHMERMMALWNVAWRREALEHYLPLGWCFKATRGDSMCGFFISQPFIFFRGATQTLWVESVVAESDEIRRELCSIAIGIGREKHLQQVLFNDTDLDGILATWKPRAFAPGISVVATTKQ